MGRSAEQRGKLNLKSTSLEFVGIMRDIKKERKKREVKLLLKGYKVGMMKTAKAGIIAVRRNMGSFRGKKEEATMARK